MVLSKIGRLGVPWSLPSPGPVPWSRPLEGTRKPVTSSKEADGWYVAISCAEVPVHPLPPTGHKTGIDLGVESFATLADGSRILTPACYRRAERRLKTAQRRVSRRKRGSHRRRTAVALLAQTHQTVHRVHRQRQDVHHKAALALALVRQYNTIYYEDVRVRNMVQNHHLAKSISDAGWFAFLTILSYKAACAGRRVFAVEPAYTSPDCGTSLHRDHNAARNILALGRQERGAGRASQAATWADAPSVA